MVYEVVMPLAGFEDENKFELEKIDDFFSLIKSKPNGIEIRVINLDTIRNIGFDIDEETVSKLELTDNSSYSIQYIFVLQNPVQKSIVNLLAPLIFNNDTKKMAQIQLDMDNLGLETLEKLLPST
jgi:flagellar assembly factor FliW